MGTKLQRELMVLSASGPLRGVACLKRENNAWTHGSIYRSSDLIDAPTAERLGATIVM